MRRDAVNALYILDPITVEVDGAQVSVPFDTIRAALPEGVGFYGGDFGAPSGYADEATIKARLDRHGEAVIKKGGYLKADEAYSDDRLRDVLLQRGFELEPDSLKPVSRLDPETANRMQEGWKRDNLQPVIEERDALAQKVETLRRDNIAASTQAALLGELKEEAFKPALPGTPSLFASLIQHGLKFEDDGTPYFQVGDGLPEADVPKAVLAYVQKHNKDLLADKRQRGSGPGGGFGGGGDTKTLTRGEFDAMDAGQRSTFIAKGGRVVD